MRGTVQVCWGRVIVLVLVGLLGGVGLGRSAHGMGCHVAEKATVGLWLEVDGASLAVNPKVDPAQLAQLPCSQEIPGALSSPVVPTGAGLFTVCRKHWTDHSEPLVAHERSVWPVFVSVVGERPPRELPSD